MKRKIKISFNSPVVLYFAAISFVVLILNYLTAGHSNKLLFMTWHSTLRSPLTYIRFFTHVLGHSGFEHFIGNMAYILLLGPILEEKYGSKVILGVIAITGLITGLLNYILFPIRLCAVQAE